MDYNIEKPLPEIQEGATKHTSVVPILPRRSYSSRENHTLQIPSSSLVSKTVIVRQAVLLALDHGLPKPSQDGFVSVVYLGFAPHYSGGTAPVFHRSSLLSLFRHLAKYYEIFTIITQIVPCRIRSVKLILLLLLTSNCSLLPLCSLHGFFVIHLFVRHIFFHINLQRKKNGAGHRLIIAGVSRAEHGLLH